MVIWLVVDKVTVFCRMSTDTYTYGRIPPNAFGDTEGGYKLAKRSGCATPVCIIRELNHTQFYFVTYFCYLLLNYLCNKKEEKARDTFHTSALFLMLCGAPGGFFFVKIYNM